MHNTAPRIPFHEPSPAIESEHAWESGAEDARTPNANAWSADSGVSAKGLECVRFIGAFRPARDGQRRGSNARFRNRRGSPWTS